MDAFSELKGLSDTADGIINKTRNHKKHLEEWFSLFKQAAAYIASNEKIISEDSLSNNELTNKRRLPDIVPFVSEPDIVAKKKQRISSALACLQKDHILHVKRSTPVKDLPCETRNKSPEQHKAVCNETFVKFTTPDNNVETSDNDTRNEKSINSFNGDDKQEFFTPVGQNPEISELQTKTGRASRKRKSSSPFFNSVSVKKVKVLNSETVSIQKKSIRKSLRVQHGKISDSKFFKYHNRLPSAKISGNGINSSVLKENRVRKKSETEDNQTLKKVLAARQIKAQEAKRKREEKMHKISQQRLKLEKEKDDRLRSRKPKEVEKPLLKTVLDSKKKRTREVEKNHNSEALSEPPSARKTRSKNTGTPIKTPREKTTEKTVEKENKIEKAQDIERNYNSEVKREFPSTQETKPGKSSTPRKPSRKKDTKLKVEEHKNENENINKTYLANSSTPDVKKTSSMVPKMFSPTKADIFKTPVPPQRTISSITANGSTTVTKSNVGRSTPLAAKQKQSNNSTLATSTNSQSYEMTPARRSSFVNYDVSEIKSDDSDDDEDAKRNPKPVPGWASGVRLKNALVQQQYHPIDTDILFGNVFDTPNLVEMMGVKSKRYFKRTSSAVWNSPSAFI